MTGNFPAIRYHAKCLYFGMVSCVTSSDCQVNFYTEQCLVNEGESGIGDESPLQLNFEVTVLLNSNLTLAYMQSTTALHISSKTHK